MKQQLIAALWAGCLVLGAQGQTSSDTSGTTSGSSNYRARPYSRMGQQELRASKLTGASVKSSQGENLGTVEDLLVNGGSGRIDFAVISYNQSGGSSSSSSSSTNSSTSPSSSSLSSSSNSGEKLVPVPWMFLRPSGTGSNTSSTTGSSTSTITSTSSSGEQPSFVFMGDKSKLDNAPSFDRSNWPDVTQSDWRQRIFSHFGMQSGSATGGATSPGGLGTGSSTNESSTSFPNLKSSTPPTPPSGTPDQR